MSTEVQVPTLGESVSEATIGQWLKQPGEAVAADEPIASLETDKVAIEVVDCLGPARLLRQQHRERPSERLDVVLVCGQ